jgi:hypothetical protein
VHALIPNVGGYWFDVMQGALATPAAIGPVVLDGERPAME